jgi:uncharacterized membrane protein
MNSILLLILITLIPALELRASIPFGILSTNLHWTTVFIICVITNIILGPAVYVILDKFIHIFLKIRIFDRVYSKYIEKTQKKIHPAIEKYGILGLAIFIGIPLPGSGSYTGALAAYILGMKIKRFIIANIIGVIIAAAIITLLALTGAGIFHIFIR